MLLGSFTFVLCVVSPQEKPVTQRPDDWSLVEGQKSISQVVLATHGLWHTCTITHEHTHTQMSQLSKVYVRVYFGVLCSSQEGEEDQRGCGNIETRIHL